MEGIAEGVWLLRGGRPKLMNVYLIEDQGGITMFDAGVDGMAKQIRKAAAPLGGVKRIVLGHGHADHRGAAPALAEDGAKVLCHEAEVADAEGDGGLHYFHCETLSFPPARVVMPRLLKMWDGGPVKIDETLSEGDEIAGFQVVHVPGHAPGLIALWRERDRLLLASDSFYTLDPQTGRRGAARVPLGAFNMDTAMAQASLRKLGALDPKIAWPGHADGLSNEIAPTFNWLADNGGTFAA